MRFDEIVKNFHYGNHWFMSRKWSVNEVKEITKDYFGMLTKEIQNIHYNKSFHRSKLKKKLSNRSEGSIEFKHQNISAILVKYGQPYIAGYKPRSNYQHLLEETVLNYLDMNDFISSTFRKFTNDIAENLNDVDFLNWIKPIPKLSTFEEPKMEYSNRIIKMNYIEEEQKNVLLGSQGEELVIKYEKWRLLEKGKESLADGVEWISKTYGDGAGFDVLSKNFDGTDRYIEVKTTKLGKYTPIYLTRNELQVSVRRESNYYLYRLYDINTEPKMFNSNGRLDEICRLEPLSFVGKF